MTMIEGSTPREAELEEQNLALEDRVSELRRENEELKDALAAVGAVLVDALGALNNAIDEIEGALRRLSDRR